MAFEHRLTVRFFEADPAGVVFFGRYFEYAHAAFEELVLAALEGERPFAPGGLGLPLVHSEAEFKRPSRHGDRLVIRSQIIAWSLRSVRFEHVIARADDDPTAPPEVRAIVRLKHAFVGADFRPIARPAAFVEAMQAMGLAPELVGEGGGEVGGEGGA